MKRILLTITLIMTFGLTAYAGHQTKTARAENTSAQSYTILGHQSVARDGHLN